MHRIITRQRMILRLREARRTNMKYLIQDLWAAVAILGLVFVVGLHANHVENLMLAARAVMP